MQIKKASYRQRVYSRRGEIILVFGNDPAPCDATLLADHDVHEVVTITEHCVEEKAVIP